MKTERTRLRREPHRGCYDQTTLYNLLDSIPLCHIAFNDKDQPYCIPNLQWREGDYVYWHGSSKSRAILAAINNPVCLTVNSIDGLVLARSAFYHSVNFRSAMILGCAEAITDPATKQQHLKHFINKLFPERYDTLRKMTDLELKSTAILRLSLKEASIKIRQGGPKEPEEDQQLPIWAGVIPLSVQTGVPIPDSNNQVDLPSHLENYIFIKNE